MSSLVDAYLGGHARAFFAGDPALAADRRAAVARARRALDPGVHAALVRQNAAFGASAARQQHLHELAQGAAAVVTGQQVGLFLGPLYTVYKAATAVVAARALRAETGVAVVPVFWLQTEDHDLAEIASCALPRGDEPPLAIELAVARDNRLSVEHVPLPASVREALDQLEAALAELPHAAEHVARLRRHYVQGAGFGAAFAGVLAELFEPEGLLLCDPRDEALARAAAPIHARALTDCEGIAQALCAHDGALRAAGFQPSVHVRPDAPLAFVHPEGAHGPRYRVAGDAARGFVAIGGEGAFTLAELLARLEGDPRTCSSSALLRPLVQDSLLPTACYVGGPGEAGYFAQLGPLYARFGRTLPLFVLRARFCVVEPRTARLLDRLGLRAHELSRGPDAALALLAERERAAADDPPSTEPLSERLLRSLTRVLDAELSQSGPVGPGLSAPLSRAHGTLRRLADKLATQHAAARLRFDRERVDAVARAHARLFPGGAPQERVLGLPYFAARYGERAFLERVLAAIDPFAAADQELCV